MSDEYLQTLSPSGPGRMLETKQDDYTFSKMPVRNQHISTSVWSLSHFAQNGDHVGDATHTRTLALPVTLVHADCASQLNATKLVPLTSMNDFAFEQCHPLENSKFCHMSSNFTEQPTFLQVHLCLFFGDRGLGEILCWLGVCIFLVMHIGTGTILQGRCANSP